MKPNELLLTTAFAMKEAPHELVELVKQMAAKGCAGLGIKTKRFLSEIPVSVLAAADELALPIIEIPVDAALGEISTQILSCILEKRTDELRYALETHRKFTDLIMEGKGTGGIIESLSMLMQKPVFLLNHRLNLLAQSYPNQYSSSVNKEEMYNLIKQSIKSLPKQTDGMLSFSVYSREENVRQTLTLFPFETHQEQQGFLVVLGMISQDPFSVLAVEQAANVIGFDFMKQHALEEHSRRIKNEFFADFLDGDISSEEEIINRGKHYGLQKMQPYICLIAKIDDSSKLYSKKFVHREERIRRFKDRIYELLEDAMSRRVEQYILFTKGDFFVILLPFTTFNDDTEQELVGLLRMIQDEIYEALQVSMSFGIGNYAEQLLDIPNCFQKATEALRSGYQSKKSRFIQTYRVKELTEMLRMIPYKNLKQFYNNTLKELADSTDREKMDLIKTLAVYLENHCQIAETAKQLYIHRNTVAYRLNKCEEILGRNLRDPNETLRLRIALIVGSLL